MRHTSWFGTGIIVAVLFGILFPETVHAIPAFARRYKVSCTVCHAPFPRLKPYGEEFAGNGFIIPEEEKDRDYVIAGDDKLRLNRTFPIALRFDAYAVYEQDTTVESDLQIPWGVKLLSGGAVGKGIGYYVYFYMTERGEVAGVEDAYIHFNNIFRTNLDIMIGQFQTSDPLLKRELRLTFEDYRLYTVRIGESKTNLAYDRGAMLTYGIDKTRTDLVAFVVNGNGKAVADEVSRKFDSDNNKSLGFRLLQGIGSAVGLGGFIYYGREQLTGGPENEIAYYGPDVNIVVGPLAFSGQYLRREDTNPTFQAAGNRVDTDLWIAELIFSPKMDRSSHYITLLYNQVDSQLDVDDYETLTLGVTYVLRRNLRLTAEYSRIFTSVLLEENTPRLIENANRGVLGLVSAF
jgi:hypothetical protein